MAANSWNLEQLGPLHGETTQDMCLQNIIGISAKLRALGSGQKFDNTFWILLMRRRWRLQTNQTHIGPTMFITLYNSNLLVNGGSPYVLLYVIS